MFSSKKGEAAWSALARAKKGLSSLIRIPTLAALSICAREAGEDSTSGHGVREAGEEWPTCVAIGLGSYREVMKLAE